MSLSQIWKFLLTSHYAQVEMPANAEILSVDVQDNIVCMWVKVDPKAPLEVREFNLLDTGQDFPNSPSFKFLGTVLLHQGSQVFHVFEEINIENL